MSNKSVLAEVHKLLEKPSKGHTVVLLAVEFNEEGIPITRLNKIEGHGSYTMAGLQMVKKQIDEEIDMWHEKIKMVTETSQKIDELLSKMGSDELNTDVMEKLIDMADDEDIKQKLRDAIKRFKNQFGK